MDDQVRVVDHDAADRATSEAQAYALFFALVANDRSRFDRLLQWTELNLAAGDLTRRLPAWLWGRGRDNRWQVLDANSASDADLWMTYTLFEAGRAWNDNRYTALGEALAQRIAAEEVVQVPDFGPVLLSGATGFRHGESYQLNISYMPLQLCIRLAHLMPEGPWQEIAARIPTLVANSSPQGFATDWIEFESPARFNVSPVGSYDAIRVYLWAGMLDPATPGRDAVLNALSGMARLLRVNPLPPAKIKQNGAIEDPRGPVGFSAALLPFAATLGDTKVERALESRMRAEFNKKTGLYGNPARYYDQNLALFALGSSERRFWFDADGTLNLSWQKR